MSEWSIRLARLEDEAVVRALSAHIWEGDDYVPDTFADWVADPLGRFYLLFVADRLAGFGKLTCLAEGEWWLEGLRVHPDFRGQGIARALHNYAVDLAEEIASGVLRFATASTNLATHHLAASTGFMLASRYLLAEAPAAAVPLPAITPDLFQPALPAEHAAVAAWLSQPAVQQITAGLYEDGWQWFSLLPALPKLLAAGRVYTWRGNLGMVIIDPAHTPQEPDTLWLNLAVAPNQADLPLLLADLRQLAVHLNKRTLEAKPPALPAMETWLAAAGWKLSEDLQMLVFSRPLPRLSDH